MMDGGFLLITADISCSRCQAANARGNTSSQDVNDVTVRAEQAQLLMLELTLSIFVLR